MILATAACSASETRLSAGSPTTTITPPTTTIGSDTNGGTDTTGDTGPGPLGVTVTLPDHLEGAPTIVLVHGGGWFGGSPASTQALADSLATRGALVFNASYRTGIRNGGYPATFDDVACAVRFARHRSSELGGSGEVILVGHSAGAHLGAVVALSDEAFGTDCSWSGSSTPDQFIGLAGVYQLEAVAPLMEIFLGGDSDSQPEAWLAADPIQHIAAANGLAMTLIHGTADTIIPPAASESFALAIEAAGFDVDLIVLERTGHNDLLIPEVTAELILP